jgi:hypothetical protein
LGETVVKHETFAVAVLIFLAVYAVWVLVGRFNDPRCHLADGDSGALVCTERAPILLPSDARDLDRI